MQVGDERVKEDGKESLRVGVGSWEGVVGRPDWVRARFIFRVYCAVEDVVGGLAWTVT